MEMRGGEERGGERREGERETETEREKTKRKNANTQAGTKERSKDIINDSLQAIHIVRQKYARNIFDIYINICIFINNEQIDIYSSRNILKKHRHVVIFRYECIC